MYEDNLLHIFPDKQMAKKVLKALNAQMIILGKPKKYGAKHYLNNDRMDKIREIVKERGTRSVILLLLLLHI